MAERINDLSANSKNPLKFSVGGALAFWFWFSWQAKIAATYLFFQNAPKAGTVFSLFLPVVFLLVTAVMTKPVVIPRRALSFPVSSKAVLLFLLWAVLSLLWTRAESAISGFGYWMEIVAEVALTLFLLVLTPKETLLRKSLQGIALGGIALGLVAMTSGVTDELGRAGDEVFLHPNLLGFRLGLAALVSWYLYIASRNEVGRRFWGCMAVILLFLLVNTLSKTSILAFIAASFVMIFANPMPGWRKYWILIGGLLVAATSFGFIADYLDEYTSRGDGQLALTLTGRTLIWAETWEMILENPIAGYGIISFRDHGPQIADVRLVTAHNEILNVFFSFGIVGLILCLTMYLALLLEIRKVKRVQSINAPELTLFSAIVVFAFVRGFAQAPLIGFSFPLALLILSSQWNGNLSSGYAMQAFMRNERTKQ